MSLKTDTIWMNPLSNTFDSIASVRREEISTAKHRAEIHISGAIGRLIDRESIFTTLQFEHRVKAIFHSYGSDFTSNEEKGIFQRAIRRKYLKMLTTPTGKLEQYSILYHNPTYHTLRIDNCGVIDEAGEVVKTVSPGAMIRIPIELTIGGNKSVINSNVPQLQPVKEQIIDICLEAMTPLSHDEWCFFVPYRKSNCCKRDVAWSNHFNAVICTKCHCECTNA